MDRHLKRRTSAHRKALASSSSLRAAASGFANGRGSTNLVAPDHDFSESAGVPGRQELGDERANTMTVAEGDRAGALLDRAKVAIIASSRARRRLKFLNFRPNLYRAKICLIRPAFPV